jgi:elongation factor G
MKSYTYAPDGDGKGKEGEIPADLASAAEAAHEALIEMVAEGNDALLEEFFDKGTLPRSASWRACGTRAADAYVPGAVRLGVAQRGERPDPEFLLENFPGPADRGPWKARSTERKPSARKDSGPVSLFVFKTIADPFAGRGFLLQGRVGRAEERCQPGERAKQQRRAARISACFRQEYCARARLRAGDIGGVASSKNALTGDTLADKSSLIAYPR